MWQRSGSCREWIFNWTVEIKNRRKNRQKKSLNSRTKSQERRNKRRSVEVLLTCLLSSARTHWEREGREHWRKRRQWVRSSCLSPYSPLFPPSFFVCHSHRSATSSIPPIFDLSRFLFLLFIWSHLSFPSFWAHQRKSAKGKLTTESSVPQHKPVNTGLIYIQYVVPLQQLVQIKPAFFLQVDQCLTSL